MKKQVFLYGLLLAALVVFLKSIEYRYLLRDLSTEVYVGVVALLFTAVGIWGGLKITQSRFLSAPAAAPAAAISGASAEAREAELSTAAEPASPAVYGISRRELEVLVLLASGHTNQEIADQLFVSLNTVKKHISSLFEKLEVKRRTQAIEKAKRLNIIP